jgi:hypothetical protein
MGKNRNDSQLSDNPIFQYSNTQYTRIPIRQYDLLIFNQGGSYGSPNLADVKIIDADGHVRDRDADIRKFMAEPYSRRVGRCPNDVWDSSMYGKLGLNITDVPTRLKDMDTEQIRHLGSFPTGGFGVTQLP